MRSVFSKNPTHEATSRASATESGRPGYRRGPQCWIVVSNREPYEHRRQAARLVCQRTDGGLTAALDPVLRRLGGTWVAWGSGPADREAVGPGDVIEVPPASPAYRLRRVWLSAEEVSGGYLGYANEVLWPLCHLTLDRVAYRQAYWDGYRSLNQRFAQAVLEEIDRQPGAAVWVHDFHLALLPRLIKQAAPHVPVSVFWHIPWPGPEIFQILPEQQAVLEGLLAADSIVFQTPGYARLFGLCAQELLNAIVDPSTQTVSYKGHWIRLAAQPISVDARGFAKQARTRRVEAIMKRERERLGLFPGLRVGLGVDRLDYTKGLLKRLWALDTFFTRYPAYRGRFTFLQIGVPTRGAVEAYRQYRNEIRQTVDAINQRHSTMGPRGARTWRPIIYHEGRIGRATLVAYYRLADLALVSSVYDGMNLVAKEYVASQVDETGVLLISQLTGAAKELTEALRINPYDTEGVAAAIKQALEMPRAERRRRMRALRAYLEKHDLRAWVRGCLSEAARVFDKQGGSGANPSEIGV